MQFRFIFTASIISPEREQQYVERISRTIRMLQHLPFKFYIVENNGKRPTALDTIENVAMLYTNTNTIKSITNKGIKEFSDILFVADRYDFDDNDIVIKLTGLYTLEDPPRFIEDIQVFEPNHDAFIKWFNICRKEYIYDDCILGLFALRYRYLKEFNYMGMRLHPSMEHIFATYIREAVPVERIYDSMHLGMYYRDDTSQLF